MRDELLAHYERELAFLRRTGAEFAQRYPKVAGRLLLEPTKCDDPHVERLLEGFSFLAARVHLKLDDDFPEISEALLDIVYPQYTRPMPSMSVVEFQVDPERGSPSGVKIPRGSILLTRPVGGVPCKFQTCYETTLWPVTVAGARWTTPQELRPAIRAGDAVAALRLELACLPDVTFGEIEADKLRLHLSAEANISSTLYELLCNNCVQIMVRDPAGGQKREPILLPGSALTPVGFGSDESMLPMPDRAFPGYRLLQEYFAFPDKFYFLDLAGFDRVRAAGFGAKAEVVFLISAFERAERRQVLEVGVNQSTVRLACAPVVNVFPQVSEPVPLHQRQGEYLVVPDARRRSAVGIYSVEEVTAVTPGTEELLRFQPLYSYRHNGDRSSNQLFWRAVRRPVAWRVDEGTDLYISFVDLSGRTVFPDRDTATLRLLCHNGDLPSRLPFGTGAADFEMVGSGPVRKIVALVKPTPAVHPALGKPQLWRLISQLSLNYMSLVDGGADGLKELLRLHNFADSDAAEKQIQGILNVEGRPHYTRIESPHGLTFARGHRVEISFDEEQFSGGGVYLLASVLERFLGAYVSLNSFCVLAARTPQRRQFLREWEPRSGMKALL